MNLFRLACLGKTLNPQVLIDCCQKAFLLSFGFIFLKYRMRSKKTVCLNFLMDKLINGIKQSVGPVMDHRFHSLRGFGAIQLRVYHELPRMKVILTDNATNYSQKSVSISFCLQKTWNKFFERDMFGWAGFLHGCLTSVKEALHKSIMKKSDRAITIISVTEWRYRSNSNCTINQGRYFICAFIP